MKYAFECRTCAHEFEVSCSISQREIPLSQPCPSCGKRGDIHRRWSGSGPMLMRSGSGKDVHSYATKRVGSDWKDLLKTIKKGSARSNKMNI